MKRTKGKNKKINGGAEMFKELLPIGSVVLLKEGTKKLMIIGIKPMKDNEEKEIYDYMGVLYPEGYLSSEYNFLFNHEDINDVIFKGYDNPERQVFVEVLEEAYKGK